MAPARQRFGATGLLDFDAPSVSNPIEDRGRKDRPRYERTGAAYGFVRDAIACACNPADEIPACEVPADGYGQFDIAGTLLTTLLRGMGRRRRSHGFTVHNAHRRGLVPQLARPRALPEITDSGVGEEPEDGRGTLESFILYAAFLQTLQREFSDTESLCGRGGGTDCLSTPPVAWAGNDTCIRKTGTAGDFGTFAAPEDFCLEHGQDIGLVRDLLDRHLVRDRMNARPRAIRRGNLPCTPTPGLPLYSHEETYHAA